MDRMNRMRKLAKNNPEAWSYAFVWLVGVANVNAEIGEHIDKAINFVERTYPL